MHHSIQDNSIRQTPLIRELAELFARFTLSHAAATCEGAPSRAADSRCVPVQLASKLEQRSQRPEFHRNRALRKWFDDHTRSCTNEHARAIARDICSASCALPEGGHVPSRTKARSLDRPLVVDGFGRRRIVVLKGYAEIKTAARRRQIRRRSILLRERRACDTNAERY